MRKLLFRSILSCLLGAGMLSTMYAQAPAPPLTFTYTYSGYGLPIPIDDANIAVLLTITVPRSVTITKVTAGVQVAYPGVGDLNVFMFSPQGTRARLLERNCGNLANIDTTFDDAGTQKFADFCPATAGQGPFQGNEPLSNFNGQDSLGIWTLAVENNGSNSRYGSAVGFSVTITGTARTQPTIAPNGVRNTAAPLVAEKPIAPGQIISIFGANLGPQTAMTTSETYWPTWIDGTVVRINGVDAPMRTISYYRIDVQVPPTLAPTPAVNTVDVSVLRNSVTTNTVKVAIAPTSPAVVTQNGTGAGQASAFHTDGTANSATNGIARGGTLSIWVNGLGLTEPLAASGQPTPEGVPFVPVVPVTATIGGYEAMVTRAILEPRRHGIFLVDVVVPNRVSSGTAEVIISGGGNSSQNGATVEVR